MSSVKLSKLTDKTTKQWSLVANKLEATQEAFVDAYRQSLVDCLGSDWRKCYKDWDNFQDAVEYVEAQIKPLCLKNGIPLTVYSRFKGASRKICFHSTDEEPIPFTIAANNSIACIKEVEKLVDEDGKGTRAQRVNRAYATIRARENEKYAANKVSKNATILPLPKQGENSKEYRLKILDLIGQHLRKCGRAIKGKDESATTIQRIMEILQSEPVPEMVGFSRQ